MTEPEAVVGVRRAALAAVAVAILIGLRRAGALMLTLVFAACSPGTAGVPSPTAVASAAEPASDFVLVALGDSIPFNSPADCPGCTGFVDGYAAALEDQLGHAVTVVNESRHDGATTSDIVEQLRSDEALLGELEEADLIVMSVGFNDQPPFAVEYRGCPEPVTESDSLSVAVERAAESTDACIGSAVDVVRGEIRDVFAAIRDRAPDARIAALTAYDTWIGWSELDAVDADIRNELFSAERQWLHAWRDALCAEAEAARAVCVDVYRAFNGPDGTDPPDEFVVPSDYTHPSQDGNDVIRDLLIDAKLLSP